MSDRVGVRFAESALNGGQNMVSFHHAAAVAANGMVAPS